LNLNRVAAPTDQHATSASDLILPHGMADHRIDIDPVENPVQLLGRQYNHRHLSARPSELVFRQPLQDQHKARAIKEQQLHPDAGDCRRQTPPGQADRAPSLRIPMKPATYSDMKPATHSEFIPATIPA
jgi:hypothetical protein